MAGQIDILRLMKLNLKRGQTIFKPSSAIDSEYNKWLLDILEEIFGRCYMHSDENSKKYAIYQFFFDDVTK